MTGAPDQSRFIWELTIRRFVEVAWTRHGPTRYLSTAIIPVFVALLTPGWWWAPCALGALVGIILGRRARAWLVGFADSLENYSDAEMRSAIGRHIAIVSATTFCYCAPYALLAFAPSPGPALGLLFCVGSAIVITTLHVMTRTMILFTIPMVAVGIMANAAALHPGWQGYVLAVMGGFVVLNAVIAARAGAQSFGDLIAARAGAEQATGVLEVRVAERTAELAEVTRAAEAANKAKSAFLTNMSHELRTPLNAIIGYSEIIEEDLASGHIEECPQDIAKVRGAALHLLKLIADLLDLSKVEADKFTLLLEDIDVAALARGALETVAPLAAGNATACDLIVEPGAAAMHADPMRVKQCLLNLLSNAAKFTRDGRIVLHVRRTLFAGEDAIAFAVRDSGIGISEASLARLFQPFVQADSSITHAYGGTGLGLAITRRFARLMGGEVTAESQLGRGSQFTLIVPLRAPAAAAPVRNVAAA